MNEARIAELRPDFGDKNYVRARHLDEALDAVEKLRSKLAITADGYAVGLADEVWHPQSDGQATHRTVWAYGGKLLAYWDHGPPVPVSECCAALTTAMEVAEEMKKENDHGT